DPKMSTEGSTTVLGPHNENFPDPNQQHEGALRVWYATPLGSVFISVASLREARLVIKVIAALTGHCAPRQMGVQWCRPTRGWVEWMGEDGETIHALPDDDPVFAQRLPMVAVTH